MFVDELHGVENFLAAAARICWEQRFHRGAMRHHFAELIKIDWRGLPPSVGLLIDNRADLSHHLVDGAAPQRRQQHAPIVRMRGADRPQQSLTDAPLS